MKQVKYAAVAIIISLLAMSFAPRGNWYLMDAKDFSILFPARPADQVKTVTSIIGNLAMNISMYDGSNAADSSTLIYSVITTQYPDTIINSSRTDRLTGFFKNSIDGAVSNVNGKLISERAISIDGFPGREIKVDYQSGAALINMRMYLVHSKGIILQTITSDTSRGKNADAARFFDSFKLKK